MSLPFLRLSLKSKVDMSLSTSIYNMLSSRNLGKAVALLGGTLLSIFFGLLACTVNPMLIGLGVGLLLGGLLLSKSDWNIWFILVSGLLVYGMVPIWADAQASKAAWGISLLGFLLMITAFYKAVSNPSTVRNTPTFVWLAFVFLCYVIVLSLFQWQTLEQFFGGLKRYFHIYGLLFAFSWLLFDEYTVRAWRKLIIWVAIAQLPAVVYELIVIVPQRQVLANVIPSLVPIDAVAGTLGTSIIAGGACAEMAFFLIAIMGFLFARWKMGLLRLGKLSLLIPLVAAPLFMGETKGVLIQLPIMFFIVFRQDIFIRPLMVVIMASVFIALITGALISYTNITGRTVDGIIADTIEYNLKEKGYGDRLLNRKTALIFWADQQGLDDPISPIFGNGMGSAEDTGSLGLGHISKKFAGYGIGLTDASQFLWEIGVLGCSLFLLILISAWFTADIIIKRAVDPTLRADASAIQAIIALLVFHLFYRNALLHTLPFQVLIFFALGYLAWSYRQTVVNLGVIT